MNRENIDKIAQSPEDRLLLAKLWDKIHSGIHRDIPAATGFLSLREQEMARLLFGSVPSLKFWGGYPDAERKLLLYMPEYMPDNAAGIACLRAKFYHGDTLTHRDFLGGLLGCGIRRDCVGDICVSRGSCDLFVTEEIAPYLLENFTTAGRVRLQLSEIPPEQAQIPEQEFTELRDTVASVRLDSIIAAGFRISRSQAAEFIVNHRVAINGLPCDRPDKTLAQGVKISLRGLGKIKLERVGGQSKKGRTCVLIHRYL